MFKNYFISVLRSLWSNKLSTLIIIFSICVAVAASLLLFKYVNYQFSFDKFNKKYDRIYRIPHKKYEMGSLLVNYATNVSSLAPWLKQSFPEVEDAVRIFQSEADLIFKYKDKTGSINTAESRIVWVDTNFCNLFPIEFIYGNCDNAFKRRLTINISESFSEKMFGKENPLGKTINLFPGYDKPLEIVGVFKDFPPNSHLDFEILMTYKHIENVAFGNDWIILPGCFTYVLLKDNVNVKDFQKKIDESLKGELGKLLTEKIVQYFPEYKNYKELIAKRKYVYDFTLQPLSQINFSSFDHEIKEHKEKRMIVFLLAISLLILIIAWINYFNLAGVKMLENTFNTQIRKVIGANNKQIFILFVIESIIINILGFFTMLILYLSIFPYFIQISNLPANLTPFSYFFNGVENNYVFLLIVLLLFFICLLIPLLMPFFKFIVPNKLITSGNTVPVRNIRSGVKSIMVVVQFVFSIFMIISVMTVYKQINFMNKKELGFNPDQILILKAPTWINEEFFKKYKPFKAEITRNPLVTDYTETTSVPPLSITKTAIKRYHNSGKLYCYNLIYNKNYFNFFNIDLVAGTNFVNGSNIMDSISRKIIINETASKQLGFKSPEEAIGKTIYAYDDMFGWTIKGANAEIVGVCRDYYHNSVRQEKKSMTFFQIPDAECLPYFCFKFRAGSASEVLALIKNKWKEYFPDFPLTNYFFLDEKFKKEYDSDIRFGIISGIFSFLSVLLACTGLFMLSSYNILKRTKEVGIRKSNGATSLQIIILFVKKFMYLILIAYVIATPVSYFIMNKWLMNYPYRIAIGLWFFLLPLFIIVLITMVTILYQVFIAARTNPVETLRYE
jgi:putative ABC transport system permease protein